MSSFSIDPDIPFIFSGAKEFHGINVIAKWYKINCFLEEL